MNGQRKFLFSLLMLFAACGDPEHEVTNEDSTEAGPGNVVVVASNYPLFYFASRIVDGIDNAPEIIFPDIDGDPAFWVPDVEQIQLLQSADLVLLNGAGAESWLSLVTLDQRRLHDTSAEYSDQLVPLEGQVRHQHGPEGEHSHQGTAFTTWLDPQLAIAQAESVTEALLMLAPSGEEQFRANMEELRKDLRDLDQQLAAVFAQIGDRPVMFSHPVYQYLQRRYGIDGRSVHWEPDEEPSTSAWVELQQLRSAHPAKAMIWESQPLDTTVARLTEAGIESIPFHTVANRPETGDFLSAMNDNASRIAMLR